MHSYYELNISCPNLFGDITFYPPKHLKELLVELKKVHISRPIFIKMPIEKSNEEIADMLHIIEKYPVSGVIFGNLQKNRKDPALNQDEVVQFSVGNFSGKPTERRSNELIAFTYKKYKQRFVIIGCGGIFSAQDAYAKIRLGASLVQLITGMIYQGPQLISMINVGLPELLERDGFSHISDAIGTSSYSE
jgi:dihydroorotate dehydrogenase